MTMNYDQLIGQILAYHDMVDVVFPEQAQEEMKQSFVHFRNAIQICKQISETATQQPETK